MERTFKPRESVGDQVSPGQGPLRPAHILIVDDNETNLRVASLICEMQGFTHQNVSSGKAAVQAASSDRFDLVLMDICMPEMDGVEAARQIHALHPGLPALPIIAVTANADLSDHARYVAAGMVAVVPKPINLLGLCDAMGRALANVASPDIHASSSEFNAARREQQSLRLRAGL